jgi:hypothetical protein
MPHQRLPVPGRSVFLKIILSNSFYFSILICFNSFLHGAGSAHYVCGESTDP